MKFDNPEHYRHWQYQNIVNRVLIVALILTYSFSVISLNPLNIVPDLGRLIACYFFFVPLFLTLFSMVVYAIIKGVPIFLEIFIDWITGY